MDANPISMTETPADLINASSSAISLCATGYSSPMWRDFSGLASAQREIGGEVLRDRFRKLMISPRRITKDVLEGCLVQPQGALAPGKPPLLKRHYMYGPCLVLPFLLVNCL